MKGMILAAGRGERLRPLTDSQPKPMLAIAGKPLLEHQLEWLVSAGIREIVINLHHLGEQIESHFGDGSQFGAAISYSHEAERLETGGGIVKALPLLGSDPFLVLNGDIYTDFPLGNLQSIPPWADIHLLLTPRPAFRDQGDFQFCNGRITARGDSHVYCGISILRPSIFADSKCEPFSLRDLFFKAVAEQRASAQIWSGYWIDIGDEAQLTALNNHLRT